MLLKLVINMVKIFIIMIINILPVFNFSISGLTDFIDLITRASWFFPADLAVVMLGFFALVTTAQVAWSIVEWIYKKIPGVN